MNHKSLMLLLFVVLLACYQIGHAAEDLTCPAQLINKISAYPLLFKETVDDPNVRELHFAKDKYLVNNTHYAVCFSETVPEFIRTGITVRITNDTNKPLLIRGLKLFISGLSDATALEIQGNNAVILHGGFVEGNYDKKSTGIAINTSNVTIGQNVLVKLFDRAIQINGNNNIIDGITIDRVEPKVGTIGIDLQSGSGNTIKNVTIKNYDTGAFVQGKSNTFEGNTLIGTASGDIPRGDAGFLLTGDGHTIDQNTITDFAKGMIVDPFEGTTLMTISNNTLKSLHTGIHYTANTAQSTSATYAITENTFEKTNTLFSNITLDNTITDVSIGKVCNTTTDDGKCVLDDNENTIKAVHGTLPAQHCSSDQSNNVLLYSVTLKPDGSSIKKATESSHCDIGPFTKDQTLISTDDASEEQKQSIAASSCGFHCTKDFAGNELSLTTADTVQLFLRNKNGVNPITAKSIALTNIGDFSDSITAATPLTDVLAPGVMETTVEAADTTLGGGDTTIVADAGGVVNAPVDAVPPTYDPGLETTTTDDAATRGTVAAATGGGAGGQLAPVAGCSLVMH